MEEVSHQQSSRRKGQSAVREDSVAAKCVNVGFLGRPVLVEVGGGMGTRRGTQRWARRDGISAETAHGGGGFCEFCRHGSGRIWTRRGSSEDNCRSYRQLRESSVNKPTPHGRAVRRRFRHSRNNEEEASDNTTQGHSDTGARDTGWQVGPARECVGDADWQCGGGVSAPRGRNMTTPVNGWRGGPTGQRHQWSRLRGEKALVGQNVRCGPFRLEFLSLLWFSSFPIFNSQFEFQVWLWILCSN
jgi:hypothetical protein